MPTPIIHIQQDHSTMEHLVSAESKLIALFTFVLPSGQILLDEVETQNKELVWKVETVGMPTFLMTELFPALKETLGIQAQREQDCRDLGIACQAREVDLIMLLFPGPAAPKNVKRKFIASTLESGEDLARKAKLVCFKTGWVTAGKPIKMKFENVKCEIWLVQPSSDGGAS